MLKVCIVGLGGISQVHITGWKALDNVEITALCDVRREMIEKAVSKTGAKNTYTDFDELLEKEAPDIIDICTPTYLHAEMAIKAMNKGINVLCEKPISLNAEDVDKIYSVAKKNNVKFMVAHVLRFWDEYVSLKKIIDDKSLGKVLSGEFYRLSAYPKWSWDNWMYDEKRSGLVPFDLHIHDLDFIIYAFGTPNSIITHRSKREKEDYLENLYEYDGFFINAKASWYNCDYPFKSGFRVLFEKGIVELENEKLIMYCENGDKKILNSQQQEQGETGINIKPCTAYDDEIKYFTDCVEKNLWPDIIKQQELETVIEILNK